MFSKFNQLKSNPLFKSIFLYAFSDGIGKAIPFLVFPIVVHYLTTAQFGAVTNFNVLISILYPLVGMSTSTILNVDYYKKGKEGYNLFVSNLIYYNLFLCFIVSIGIFLLLDSLSAWTGLSHYYILAGLVIAFFYPFVSLYTTKLRLDDKAKVFVSYNIFVSVLGALLTYLFLAVFNWSFEGRINSILYSSIVGGAIALFLLLKTVGKFYKPDYKLIVGFFIFGFPLIPHNLSFWLKSGFEKLFITETLGLSENGIFSFAATINSIFTIFATSFFAAFSPNAYKLLNQIGIDKQEEFLIKKNLVKKSWLFISFYGVILIVGFFAGWYLVSHFFQLKYEHAVIYLPYFLIANFFSTVYSLVALYLFYVKKTKFLGLLTITSSLFQVLLTIVLVKKMGAVGAGIANAIAALITAVIVFVYSNKVFPMPWFKIFKNSV